jgi:hypothetical protein
MPAVRDLDDLRDALIPLPSLDEAFAITHGARERNMRPQKTFQAITRLLADGSWHAIDDLGDTTTWPEEWAKELQAEGLLETREQAGNVLVRLRPEAFVA